ncbi:hypothetical protein [Streptomyces sp. NPDC059003]
MPAAGPDGEQTASRECPERGGTMFRPLDENGALDPVHQWLCGDCGHTLS